MCQLLWELMNSLLGAAERCSSLNLFNMQGVLLFSHLALLLPLSVQIFKVGYHFLLFFRNL